MAVTRICGGNIVTPAEVIEGGTVTIENGRIVEISRSGTPAERGIDAKGRWVLPGLIDTHSDTIEREIQPRPGSVFPIDISFSELERKLAGHGITTIHHSLSLHGDDSDNIMRKNKNVEEYITFIKNASKNKFLVNHKVHLRLEITNIEAVPLVERLMENQFIDQISFMDHTPGQGQWRDIELQKKLIMSKNNVSPEDIDGIIRRKQGLPKLDTLVLKEMAKLAGNLGIPVASHDDDSLEKLDAIKDWNVSISEFPIKMEVAEEAKRRGMKVVMGAPNVLLGRSHSNNLSAKEAIKQGVVDILCSDYYPPSLIQSVFKLHYEGLLPINEAVNMVSANPAQALGAGNKTGSIEEGKDGDLLIVSEFNKRPVIESVLLAGKVVYGVNYHVENDLSLSIV